MTRDEMFLALRQSGYTGPITQDGEIADETNTPREVLEMLARLRERARS